MSYFCEWCGVLNVYKMGILCTMLQGVLSGAEIPTVTLPCVLLVMITMYSVVKHLM